MFVETATEKETNGDDDAANESRSTPAVAFGETFATETLAPPMKSVDVQSVQGPFS